MTGKLVIATLLLALAASAAPRTPLTPDFHATLPERPLAAWTFDQPADAWPALNQCHVAVTGGILRIEGTGEDAYLRIPIPPTEGPLVVRFKFRATSQGPAEIYWASAEHPDMAKNGSIRITGINDGHWHTCEVLVATSDKITVLRFDPATQPGLSEIAEASVAVRPLHPLQFSSIEVDGDTVAATVSNNTDHVVRFVLNGEDWDLGPTQFVAVSYTLLEPKAFGRFKLSAAADGIAPLERVLYLHDPAGKLESKDFGNSNVLVQIARDRSGARLLWKGQLAAIASPLPAKCDIRVEGDDVIFDASPDAAEAGVSVRAVGAMKQGLLAGVEYLGAGEESSSKLDVERREHIRFEPDRRLITMPLAAYVTDKATVAMHWDDMTLQPVFSTPNRYDNTDDHLMGLKGSRVKFRIRLGDGAARGGSLDDAILWAVKQRGLPELPKPPRTPEQQRDLDLRAMNGALRTSNGWYHATWPGQPQHFFADHASTMFLLTGEVPQLPTLVPNGAHVNDQSSWLLSVRARPWLNHLKAETERTLRAQQPDGSFRYDGKYRRGHFEDTASGVCAIEALKLLVSARITGDPTARDAALKTLDYMKRFDVPRGAQTWEIPLHTPDILAAAKACSAYLHGYEFTGRADYLDLARRWAIRGLPFIYMWGDKPVMKYGSIAVLGATDWTGVVWIGLPVQWCGTVYADALLDLARYDKTLDWQGIAEGILIAAEQMQYPDGEFAGTLPDSFNLGDQRRLPAYVNPCVLVSLRERIAGRHVGIAVATNESFRVAAPFPVRIENNRALVQARAGLTYQLVINGTRIIDVTSKGTDEIPLTP